MADQPIPEPSLDAPEGAELVPLTGWPYPWQGPFLRALMAFPNAVAAARVARISYGRIYQEDVRGDPAFREAWDQAVKVGKGVLERVAWEWATLGLAEEETITRVHRDAAGAVIEETVTTTRRLNRNAAMTIFMLKAAHPEIYRERFDHHHSAASGGPIQHEIVSQAPRTPERAAELLKIEFAKRPELLAELGLAWAPNGDGPLELEPADVEEETDE